MNGEYIRNDSTAPKNEKLVLSLHDLWKPADSVNNGIESVATSGSEPEQKSLAAHVFSTSQTLHLLLDKAEKIVEEHMSKIDEIREDTEAFIKDQNKRISQRVAKAEKAKNKELAAVKAQLDFQATLPAQHDSTKNMNSSNQLKNKKSLLISVENNQKPSVFDRLTKRMPSEYETEGPIVINRVDDSLPKATAETASPVKVLITNHQNLQIRKSTNNQLKTSQQAVSAENVITARETVSPSPASKSDKSKSTSGKRNRSRSDSRRKANRRRETPKRIDRSVYQRCMDYKHVRSYGRMEADKYTKTQRGPTWRKDRSPEIQRRNNVEYRRFDVSPKRTHSRQRSPFRKRSPDRRTSAGAEKRGERQRHRSRSQSERRKPRRTSSDLERRCNSASRDKNAEITSGHVRRRETRKESISPAPRRQKQERGRSRIRQSSLTPTNAQRVAQKATTPSKRNKYKRDSSTSDSSSSVSSSSRSSSSTSDSSSTSAPAKEETKDVSETQLPAEQANLPGAKSIAVEEEQENVGQMLESVEQVVIEPPAELPKPERVVIRFSEEAKAKFRLQPQGVTRRFHPYQKPRTFKTKQQYEQELKEKEEAERLIQAENVEVEKTGGEEDSDESCSTLETDEVVSGDE